MYLRLSLSCSLYSLSFLFIIHRRKKQNDTFSTKARKTNLTSGMYSQLLKDCNTFSRRFSERAKIFFNENQNLWMQTINGYVSCQNKLYKMKLFEKGSHFKQFLRVPKTVEKKCYN